MVEPTYFGFNEATADSNVFQHKLELSNDEIRARAMNEFDSMVTELRSKGIEVITFPSTVKESTDAVFPNNWVSFHDGTMVLYPMMAENRRTEREPAIIEQLKADAGINELIDLSDREAQQLFLEGTGSIVFDHINRTAYACRSPRTDIGLFDQLSDQLDYQAISFTSTDVRGQAIYHTNVMMGIGTGYAVICEESIEDALERSMVMHTLGQIGDIVNISHAQTAKFCGNVIEVSNGEERFLAMSRLAYEAFTPDQLEMISRHATPLPFSIPTIETIGGGSVRCMIAQVG